MDAGGVQELLRVPRSKHTFAGLSFAFFGLSAIPIAFERVVSSRFCFLHPYHVGSPLCSPNEQLAAEATAHQCVSFDAACALHGMHPVILGSWHGLSISPRIE